MHECILLMKRQTFKDIVSRRRERGRIPVKGVRLVETATVNGEGGDPFAPDGYPFQVGYCESSDDQSQRTVPQYTLYLVANTEKERSDWIYAIRQDVEARGEVPSIKHFRTRFNYPSFYCSMSNHSGNATVFERIGEGGRGEIASERSLGDQTDEKTRELRPLQLQWFSQEMLKKEIFVITKRANDSIYSINKRFVNPYLYLIFIDVCIYVFCEDTNTPKSFRFHPGLWSGKRWSCCKSISRATFGCQAATHWRETNNNPTQNHFVLYSHWKYTQAHHPNDYLRSVRLEESGLLGAIKA
uniref:PH domain-containing protein n=1 Tax=Glossina palpalis gambiensis TaxID=67801 RepID=A0A1B0BLA6_9MUSC